MTAASKARSAAVNVAVEVATVETVTVEVVDDGKRKHQRGDGATWYECAIGILCIPVVIVTCGLCSGGASEGGSSGGDFGELCGDCDICC